MTCGEGWISTRPCSWVVTGFFPTATPVDSFLFIGGYIPLQVYSNGGGTPFGPIDIPTIPGGTAIGGGFTGSTGGFGTTVGDRTRPDRPYRPRPIDPTTDVGGGMVGGTTPIGGNPGVIGGNLRPIDPPGPGIVTPNIPIGDPTVIIDPTGGGDVVGTGISTGGTRIVED